MDTRVIIADDHPVVLQGVRRLFELDGRHQVVGEARDPAELAGLLEDTPADVLVTDFSMPGGTMPDGHSMLAAIRRHHPTLPIVLMTMFTSVPSLTLALHIGVRGLVDKGASVENIVGAVSKVRSGLLYIDESLRHALDAKAPPVALSCLSPRELEVLRLYASGPSITEIAAQLRRTVSTISRQRISAMRKLGIRNEAELFAYSLEHGLTAVTRPTQLPPRED